MKDIVQIKRQMPNIFQTTNKRNKDTLEYMNWLMQNSTWLNLQKQLYISIRPLGDGKVQLKRKHLR